MIHIKITIERTDSHMSANFDALKAAVERLIVAFKQAQTPPPPDPAPADIDALTNEITSILPPA